MMRWSAEEHEALLRFLDDVRSPDPAVQAENILQLHRLAHWAAAPYAILEVMCSSSHTPPIRQAAVLILKQLLQTNPEFMERLDVKAVEPALLNALADPIPNVRVGASLVVASVLSGGDPFCKWPMLLQTLHQKSYHMLTHCQRENNPEDLLFILQSVSGLATCVRILCEECGGALYELFINDEEACRCLSELLQHLMQTVSVLLHHTSSALQAATAVVEAVTGCFTEKVFVLDGDGDEDLEGSLSESDHLSSCEQRDVSGHAASLHGACCLFLASLASCLTDTSLLRAVVNYMNTSLQWSEFGCNATLRAAAAVLPEVLRHVTNADEEAAILCLEFIAYLAENTAGGAAGLSNASEEVAAVVFRCGVMSSSVLNNPELERTTHLPDTEATVCPIVSCQRTKLMTMDEDDMNNGSNDEDEDDHHDVAGVQEDSTLVRQALTRTLNVMCCTCRNDVLAHLVPILASVLAEQGAHGNIDSQKLLEAALFLFAEMVEELFDSLDSAFVLRVAQTCRVVLSSGVDGAYLSPYVVRFQAVRCIARISSGCVANVRQTTLMMEAMSPSLALQLFADVVDSDTNKQVQMEAIHSITYVALALLEECRRSGGADALCLPTVFQRLLGVFPSLQLGARTATYRSISQVFPMALDQPPLLDENTVLRAMAVFMAHGYQLGCSLFPTASETAPLSAAVELVSLLSALLDVTCGAGGAIVTQTLAPLVSMGTMLLNCCSSDISPSPLAVYGSDVITLVFDLLDGCCDAVLSEQEALCPTEASRCGQNALRDVMMTITGETVNCQTHVVGLCLQVMESHPVEVELRRSGLAFLSGVVRFCSDPAILWRIYCLCVHETSCTPLAEKVVSNVFFCLAQIFYRLVFHESSETTSLFCASLSEQELRALGDTLRHFLLATQVKGSNHVKTNAFNCALTLTALCPMALSHGVAGDAPAQWLLEHVATFLPQMEGDVGDQFCALTTLAVLFSEEQRRRRQDGQQQPPQHGRQREAEVEGLLRPPPMVAVCEAVQKFATSAPATLAAEVWRCWTPWMDSNSR